MEGPSGGRFAQRYLTNEVNRKMNEIPDSKSHFVREAKFMFLLPLLLILFIIIAALLAPRIMNQVEIDRCLDSGGKFDYNTNQCVHQESIKESTH